MTPPAGRSRGPDGCSISRRNVSAARRRCLSRRARSDRGWSASNRWSIPSGPAPGRRPSWSNSRCRGCSRRPDSPRRRRRLHVARPRFDPHRVRGPWSARRWRRRRQVSDSIARGRASGRGPRVPHGPVGGTLAMARTNTGRERARRSSSPCSCAPGRCSTSAAARGRHAVFSRQPARSPSSCSLRAHRSCGSFRRLRALNLLDRRPTCCWPP